MQYFLYWVRETAIDGARLNALLSQAGSKVLEVGRLIAGAAQEKITQITKSESADAGASHATDKPCSSCGQTISLGNVFCGGCGTKAVVG